MGSPDHSLRTERPPRPFAASRFWAMASSRLRVYFAATAEDGPRVRRGAGACAVLLAIAMASRWIWVWLRRPRAPMVPAVPAVGSERARGARERISRGLDHMVDDSRQRTPFHRHGLCGGGHYDRTVVSIVRRAPEGAQPRARDRSALLAGGRTGQRYYARVLPVTSGGGKT